MRRATGQVCVEQVILLVAAAMALVALFPIVRNALSHRFKSGVDGIGHGMRYQNQ